MFQENFYHCTTNIVYFVICIDIVECQEMEFSSPQKAEAKTTSCVRVDYLEDRQGRAKQEKLNWECYTGLITAVSSQGLSTMLSEEHLEELTESSTQR